MDVANNVSFVPLCAVSLSLLEGGANGIDDTATQFAEVRGIWGRIGWVKGLIAIIFCVWINFVLFFLFSTHISVGPILPFAAACWLPLFCHCASCFPLSV